MNIINLTAHTINVINGENEIAYPSQGLARVKTEEKEVGKINGISVVKTVYTTVEGLPDQEDGTIYIVSTLVLQALKANGVTRTDCVAPNTGLSGAIRNEAGQIVGVRGFQTL